jgi:hypothetical protein
MAANFIFYDILPCEGSTKARQVNNLCHAQMFYIVIFFGLFNGAFLTRA